MNNLNDGAKMIYHKNICICLEYSLNQFTTISKIRNNFLYFWIWKFSFYSVPFILYSIKLLTINEVIELHF